MATARQPPPEPSPCRYTGALADLPEEDRRRLLDRGRTALAEARLRVQPILDDVRTHGDAALRRLTLRFDGADLEALAVGRAERRRLAARVPRAQRAALEAMARRIRAYHKPQVPRRYEVRVQGATLGWEPVPLDRVGIYVPGGQASYPSTVLMAAIPAKLAGVREVVACTPPRRDGSVSPLLLAAAEIAGVDAVVRVGGAQAVAAMAYGTASVPRVQKIVGPGNVYVQAAKQLVSDLVGIDGLAGPSEVLVLADGSAPARLAAWELAAQAEHDANAVSVVVATSGAHAAAVEAEVRAIAPKLDRADVVQRALAQAGAILHADLDEAIAFANAFAPEHLVLQVRSPRRVLRRIRAAGSVFLGPHAPVALGDYGAGTNHILPTSGNASFASALGAHDFVRHVQWQDVPSAALRGMAGEVTAIAREEGLTAHAGAVEARLGAAGGGARGRSGGRARKAPGGARPGRGA